MMKQLTMAQRAERFANRMCDEYELTYEAARRGYRAGYLFGQQKGYDNGRAHGFVAGVRATPLDREHAKLSDLHKARLFIQAQNDVMIKAAALIEQGHPTKAVELLGTPVVIKL